MALTQQDFIIHACEQVLRFTQVEKWDDLPEKIKVQLGFNMGVLSLGLNLSKENSFLPLSNANQGNISMQSFREHLKTIISSHNVQVDKTNIARPF